MTALALFSWGVALLVFSIGVIAVCAALLVLRAVLGLILVAIARRPAPPRPSTEATLAQAIVAHALAEPVAPSLPVVPEPQASRRRWN